MCIYKKIKGEERRGEGEKAKNVKLERWWWKKIIL
jgi:hypothetical protein